MSTLTGLIVVVVKNVEGNNRTRFVTMIVGSMSIYSSFEKFVNCSCRCFSAAKQQITSVERLRSQRPMCMQSVAV